MWTILMSEMQNSDRLHQHNFPGSHSFQWQRYTPRTLMICKYVITENSTKMHPACVIINIIDMFKCFSSKWIASKTGRWQWLWAGFRRAFCNLMSCSDTALAYGSSEGAWIIHTFLARFECPRVLSSSILISIYMTFIQQPPKKNTVL